MFNASDLSLECAAIYPNGVDASAGMEMCSDLNNPKMGKVLKAFEDGNITVDRLLDNIDLKLEWYKPSDFAWEFMTFIRLVLGEDPENSNPIAHYFFIDCVFQQPNVEPFFLVRNIPYQELKDRIVILASREFSKSTLMCYIFLWMADSGSIPGFGKVNYGIYISDSMTNGVETTMNTIKKVYMESEYLRGRFEETRLIQTEVNFVRHPRTPREIAAFERAVNVEKLKPNQVPGRMKRTFTLSGIGAATGGRGSRDGLARPDFTVFDDLLPSERDANSETILKAAESTIEADMLPGMNNNANFSIMIGTPYSKRDTVYRRVELGTWLPIVFPRGNGLPEDEKKFVSVWPDRHSYRNCRRDYTRAIKTKEAGDASVMRKLLQEHYLRISSDEDKLVPEDLIQFYNRSSIMNNAHEFNWYMTSDFTTTGNDGSDLSGAALWAVGGDNNIFLVDLQLRRMELEEQYMGVIDMVRRYGGHVRMIQVGVELDGGQNTHILALQDRMIKHNTMFSFAKQRGKKLGDIGIRSRLEGGTKHWRFRMTLPYFQNRKIWFPNELNENEEFKELMEEIKYTTYGGFGTKYDDGCDLISMLAMMDIAYPAINGGEIFDPNAGSGKMKSREEINEERFWGRNNGNNMGGSAYEGYMT